ncbi:MAG TPA: ferrous iron transport protein B [Verrucomicrobiae bacterium]|nr:ferrous iron transport protein B [Verrucomicrobiae bacterium]
MSATASYCSPAEVVSQGTYRLVLAGNPNGGKTTLFNALTGLRAQTANYPGTTVERRVGHFTMQDETIEVIDLPGFYDLQATSEEERVAVNVITGRSPRTGKPDAAIVVADAMNLSRSLFLVSQIVEMKLPVVVALNMMDLAEAAGIRIDARKLARALGCPVIPLVARTGRGLGELRRAIQQLKTLTAPAPSLVTCTACGDCRFKTRYAWTDAITDGCVEHSPRATHPWTERLDAVLTHPVIGVLVFFGVMLGVFFLIFRIAHIPMDLIDVLFTNLGSWIEQRMPAGDLRSLLVKGVIGGMGGMLVFLPQICILFFCLSLLEDTGYLARAAFVMDRLMRRVGLPGKAFVPLLSAHACAIPAIMASRVIEDKRDRLVTILVLPLVSCSARIPVYSMLAALLFAHDAWKAALVFSGAYTLGLVMAIVAALALKHTILKGETHPLVLELPSYKLPSLRTAILMMLDRAWVFIRKAGTVILLISIALWALATYPKSAPPPEAIALQEQAAKLTGPSADELQEQASWLISHSALANSAAGRLGHWIEPAIRPLGFDWQIGIGIISSFAAREVVVSTLAVVYGVGEDAAEKNPESLYDSLRRAQRSNGTKVFTTATCASLLVFYVLAMQCLATQAITRRETNSFKWPVFQLGYMTVLAYLASVIVYQGLRALGVS